MINAGFGRFASPAELHGAESHTENETEVSFFNRKLYEEFKLNPEVSPPLFTTSHSPLLDFLGMTSYVCKHNAIDINPSA